VPTFRDVQKYMRYPFESESFHPVFDSAAVDEKALQTARAIRDPKPEMDRGPAIIIHGIMARSGTVYLGQLLRLHPDLYAFPNNIWEFPFLQQTDRALALQENFLWTHEQNFDKIGEHDFLPLFGASLISYLHANTPPGKRLLLKVPSVQYLSRFFEVFPYENLLVLTRDGRDLVQSTIHTWPEIRFSMVCLRYKRAAEMVLACDRRFSKRSTGYWLGRFEDAVLEPQTFVRRTCEHFGLDPEKYPYDRIDEIRVHGSSHLDQKGQVTWESKAKPQAFQPIGRWQSWSAYHKWLFKRIAGNALRDLGYVQDSQW
jgi:hypothetical protein